MDEKENEKSYKWFFIFLGFVIIALLIVLIYLVYKNIELVNLNLTNGFKELSNQNSYVLGLALTYIQSQT